MVSPASEMNATVAAAFRSSGRGEETNPRAQVLSFYSRLLQQCRHRQALAQLVHCAGLGDVYYR